MKWIHVNRQYCDTVVKIYFKLLEHIAIYLSVNIYHFNK